MTLALPLLAAQPGATRASATALPNPVVMVIILAALSLAPFVLIMLTSFVKISVVLSILRNAIGTQSVPPNQVITGLALVLSIFVMTPVARQMYHDAGSFAETRDIFSEASVKSIFDGIQRSKEPLRSFLSKHAHNPDRLLFIQLAARLNQTTTSELPHAQSATTSDSRPLPVSDNRTKDLAQVSTTAPSTGLLTAQLSVTSVNTHSQRPKMDDFQVLIPAFVTSQLKEAFEIGFLVFVPFIIIDMVIANVLLAMGMMMLSPSVISLPFKLLLFILVDGWFLIVRGLVLSYT
jgi:type III secretion protein R